LTQAVERRLRPDRQPFEQRRAGGGVQPGVGNGGNPACLGILVTAAAHPQIGDDRP